MNTDCVNCKHARLWTDKEQFEYIERMYKSIGRMPCRADHYICDKIPEGTEWTDDGKTYTYDGYSLDGENYDEVFHCFEPQESEVRDADNDSNREDNVGEIITLEDFDFIPTIIEADMRGE